MAQSRANSCRPRRAAAASDAPLLQGETVPHGPGRSETDERATRGFPKLRQQKRTRNYSSTWAASQA
eukprot:7061538-Alexandrium_andersonii.AAC.1